MVPNRLLCSHLGGSVVKYGGLMSRRGRAPHDSLFLVTPTVIKLDELITVFTAKCLRKALFICLGGAESPRLNTMSGAWAVTFNHNNFVIAQFSMRFTH